MIKRFQSALSAVFLLLLFSRCGTESVKDIDGNVYETVKIGEQIWLAGDLKVTHFNDGAPIPHVASYEAWQELTTPAFCRYNNDSTGNRDYGALYNWYAVKTGKLCPEGWHASTETDWDILVRNTGGSTLAAGLLKEQGSEHWKSPNAPTSGESGFRALPSGYRSYNGSFSFIGKTGYWWTSDGQVNGKVSIFQMSYKSTEIAYSIGEMTNGCSVRCVKSR